MAFGILEPKTKLANVPGTTLLDVHDQAAVDHSRVVKKGTGRNAHVVLIPQPSDDPNDPLNWPLWHRDLLLLLITTCVLLCISTGPILSSITVPLLTEFQIDYTKVSLLTGYNLCATGAIGIFMAALCRKYGKRPGLLFSVASCFIGSVWAAAATSYNSFVGARVMQGMGAAFFESVVFALIGDIYFVHERGVRISCYIACLSGLSNLPVVLSGKISDTLGWRWIFRLYAIFVGIALVAVIFFGVETAYNREAIYDIDNSSEQNLQTLEELKPRKDETQEALSDHIERAEPDQKRRSSYWQRIAPFSDTYSEDPLWKMIVSPFLILSNAAVLWSTMTISFPVLWIVGISLVIAQIFSVPPYSLTPTQIGYISTGPVISGLFANLFCAIVSDWSVKWLSRKNNGIYEPEFRLFLLIGLVLSAALGYFLFGYLISHGSSVVVISVIYAIITGGAQFAAVCVGAYMVDAYRALSVDVFIIGMVFKNFLFFGFSYFLNDWVALQGPRRFFYTTGGIQLALCCLTVPLYIYGKRLRAWWHSVRLFD